MHPLDNPAWHALAGPHRALGETLPGAARYQPDVTPFAALPDAPTEDDWRALATLVGPRGLVVLFRPAEVQAPDGWRETFRAPTVQMVGGGARSAPSARAVRLGDADVDDMLALVAATKPGPFLRRTIELGTYLGIRGGGALLAMAGERMRPPGYTEISAVCTADAARGRGLATELVCALVEQIQARGETPFLHAAADNHDAIRLYAALGFTLRASFDVVALRPPREAPAVS
ncbi:MAG TPA: GNAT family N-acetyltransferase [Candidatus Binatia bacterium]